MSGKLKTIRKYVVQWAEGKGFVVVEENGIVTNDILPGDPVKGDQIGYVLMWYLKSRVGTKITLRSEATRFEW